MITKYQLYQERRLSVTVVTRNAKAHPHDRRAIPAPLRANAGERLLSETTVAPSIPVDVPCTGSIVRSPFPLMLTYGPKHENFKADAADLDIDRFS